MRHATASQLLGKRHASINSVPREGTKLREVYDLFQANKGRVVHFTRPRSSDVIAHLIDFYGLDILCLKRGHWVLAGEWFGKIYVDYLAERIAA